MTPSTAAHERVLHVVTQLPGHHVREIARRARVPLTSTLAILRGQEDAGRLSRAADGRIICYFPAHIDGRYKLPIMALRHPHRSRILKLLQQQPREQHALAKQLRISKSTTSSHITWLARHSLIQHTRTGRSRTYSLTDPNQIQRALTLLTLTPTKERDE